MLSKEVIEFAEKIPQLSTKDKQWLLEQLKKEISLGNINQSNNQKIFNITPAKQGSGYNDSSINHDQIFVNSLLSE